jgi:hypothetical protein
MFRFPNKMKEMQLGQVELYGYTINDPAAPWAVAPPLFTVSTLSLVPAASAAALQ